MEVVERSVNYQHMCHPFHVLTWPLRLCLLASCRRGEKAGGGTAADGSVRVSQFNIDVAKVRHDCSASRITRSFPNSETASLYHAFRPCFSSETEVDSPRVKHTSGQVDRLAVRYGALEEGNSRQCTKEYRTDEQAQMNAF